MNEQEQNEFREDVYSKALRAGKRTYFFDVKATKKDEYFLTITESKRIFESEGKFNYQKHKIFLYREDFESFFSCLQETLQFIETKRKPIDLEQSPVNEFNNVEFEDLKSLE